MTTYDEQQEMFVAIPPHGQVVKVWVSVHRQADCVAPCAIHSPSHHMADWPMVMRGDKDMLIERTCAHGVGHPDPDSLRFIEQGTNTYLGVHGCDGCCKETTDD